MKMKIVYCFGKNQAPFEPLSLPDLEFNSVQTARKYLLSTTINGRIHHVAIIGADGQVVDRVLNPSRISRLCDGANIFSAASVAGHLA